MHLLRFIFSLLQRGTKTLKGAHHDTAAMHHQHHQHHCVSRVYGLTCNRRVKNKRAIALIIIATGGTRRTKRK